MAEQNDLTNYNNVTNGMIEDIDILIAELQRIKAYRPEDMIRTMPHLADGVNGFIVYWDYKIDKLLENV